MSRTLTALFDTRADAEAGRQRLLDARVDVDHIRIHDQSSIPDTGDASDGESGVWSALKHTDLSDADRYVYEEGVRRGGFLLVADIGDHEAGDAIRALEDVGRDSVDIGERASEWKSEGWTPPAGAVR